MVLWKGPINKGQLKIAWRKRGVCRFHERTLIETRMATVSVNDFRRGRYL